ncbi:NADH-ubiquinone oxidoreductase [Aureimonas endophytica]|uniref:NADH-ubiquinone oxidoreductase n=1 Tax=Aureimonas endophytica TaxID=2027858 RepID=A0A916ZEH8_9HYPH|nr:ETC complex I subunit [Aureimonas endophytica]GGD90628.1 NADH-ubiquinone oxidoreductase [Aureimonas endophytica]
MVARIYRPARTAMQSGKAQTKDWRLTFDRQSDLRIEPLMGYQSSSDTLPQVVLTFDSREQAVEFAERHQIPYRVEEPKEASRRRVSYSDNFRYDRRQPWTH